MAILKSGKLSFEIVFSDYDSAGWVQYQFYFRWNDEPLVRDDLFTFIAMVDAYNFREADAYYGAGLSLQLIVERRDLEKFVADLQQEYQEFCEKFGVGRTGGQQIPTETLYD